MEDAEFNFLDTSDDQEFSEAETARTKTKAELDNKEYIIKLKEKIEEYESKITMCHAAIELLKTVPNFSKLTELTRNLL